MSMIRGVFATTGKTMSHYQFRARKIHLWQIVLSKKGVVGGYKSLR